MKVIVFGGSGLIGDGFLQESLRADDVREVVAVVRAPLAVTHPRLRQVVHGDFLDLTPIRGELAGADACFWGLGVSSLGVGAADYERITFGYTAAAVAVLAELNPALTFVYVSGVGTDGTERGRSRWARVKGRTENLVLAAFPRGYALRPGYVHPTHVRRSKTRWYRWSVPVMSAVAPLVRVLGLGPALMTTTAEVGRVALHLARHGYSRRVLDNRDIVAVGALAGSP